jgi:hypothetical protein
MADERSKYSVVNCGKHALDVICFLYFCLQVISGFPREVDENCALLGHYAASSGNSLPTFRNNLSVTSSGFLRLEDGTDILSRIIGKKLPLNSMFC